MPLYEYVCAHCRNRFEALVRSAEAETPVCPDCGSRRLQRVISTFAVSRSLTPCGVPASDAPASCSAGGDAGCACCGGGGLDYRG